MPNRKTNVSNSINHIGKYEEVKQKKITYSINNSFFNSYHFYIHPSIKRVVVF